MEVSVLSLPLCCRGTFCCGVLLNNIRQHRGLSPGHKSHMSCSFFFVWFETGPFVDVCVVGLVFLFFVPFSLLAVFEEATAFNQNVSTWNTGSVTTMHNSKCALSSFLLATAPSVVVCC